MFFVWSVHYKRFHCTILPFVRKSKKSRKVSESLTEESSDSEKSSEEDEGEGEGVWVEKKVQQEAEGAFVGPTPEIKVQAVTSMKE